MSYLCSAIPRIPHADAKRVDIDRLEAGDSKEIAPAADGRADQNTRLGDWAEVDRPR